MDNYINTNEQITMVSSIVLQHTNPSLGPYEKIITIRLANTPETVERINKFFNESIINDSVTIGEYITAHINTDNALLSEVRSNFDSNKPLNEGESISHLTFYFKNNIPTLEISDVYRRWSVTNFYGDFTKYMVENGSKSITSNDIFDAPNDQNPDLPIKNSRPV